jgi:single-strand DNA-binding protein
VTPVVNRVVLVGRLGTDPEVKVTGSGLTVCRMRLAVSRPWAKEGQQDTDWLTVIAWRKTAEFCANYLKKGYLIAVDGSVRSHDYETQQGEKRTAVEIQADDVRNLQPRERGAGGGREEAPFPPDPFEAPGGGGSSSTGGSRPSGQSASAAKDAEEVFGESGDDFDPFADA